MTKGLNAALSSTSSTSRPISVRRVQISSSVASVSRCSFSQESVNFIVAILRSSAEAAEQRRHVERAEAVMRHPADVGVEEVAQVGHAVFQHGDAVEAHAPGKALIFIRIEPAITQHVRMDHAAAEDLHPVGAFAELDDRTGAVALDVDLEGGLGEREEGRAKAHRHAVDLEEGLAELLEHPADIGDIGLLVDDQALDLMEHRRMRGIAVLAIGLAGNDDADRRLLRFHGAHLHRRGVGAQHLALTVLVGIEEEGVVHLAGRVAFGKIQRGEIVIIGLDIGTLGDREAHVGEDRGDLIDDLADRMDAAALGRRGAHRQADIDRFGLQPRIDRRHFQHRLAFGDGIRHGILQGVDRSPSSLALLRRHGAERLQEFRDRAFLAEGRHAHGFQGGLVIGGGDFREQR
ncbi:hypothetical protein RHECNPAF_253009 [Rhizobium etli CNPAF512]|nr:hypothetical protein RHECNPAF_253009 [Rhizobium etli CNPAF512]